MTPQRREFHVPVIDTDGGPWAEHDQVCAVCVDRHAVLHLNDGRFHPCWECDAKGWQLVQRRPGPLARWMMALASKPMR